MIRGKAVKSLGERSQDSKTRNSCNVLARDYNRVSQSSCREGRSRVKQTFCCVQGVDSFLGKINSNLEASMAVTFRTSW